MKTRTWLHRVLLLIFAWIIVLPAAAITIIPGTYKMHWTLSTELAEQGPFPHTDRLTKITSEDTHRFSGIMSSDALLGQYGPVAFLVDESKGTNRGYDVLYLLPNNNNKERISLKTTPRVHLVKKSTILWKANMASLNVNPIVGGNGSKSRMREVVKSIELDKAQDTDGSTAYVYRADIRGEWKGWVNTDTGKLVISADNAGFTNDFSAPISQLPGAPCIQVGAVVSIDAPKDREQILFLGTASRFDGKLYDVKVTPNGDAVTIRPYAGRTAVIKVKGIDGFGKPLNDVREIAAVGLPGYFVNLDNSSQITVPAGTYEVVSAEFKFEKGKTSEIRFDKLKVVAPADKTMEITLGGPIKLEIKSLDQSPFTNSKQQHRFNVKLYIDENMEACLQREADIRVKDSSGKVVARGKTLSNDDMGRHYDLSTNDTWPVGTYTIEATMEMKPYQNTVTASAEFVIEQTPTNASGNTRIEGR